MSLSMCHMYLFAMPDMRMVRLYVQVDLCIGLLNDRGFAVCERELLHKLSVGTFLHNMREKLSSKVGMLGLHLSLRAVLEQLFE